MYPGVRKYQKYVVETRENLTPTSRVWRNSGSPGPKQHKGQPSHEAPVVSRIVSYVPASAGLGLSLFLPTHRCADLPRRSVSGDAQRRAEPSTLAPWCPPDEQSHIHFTPTRFAAASGPRFLTEKQHHGLKTTFFGQG